MVLKICFTTYRGNMFCGGQGIYAYYLTQSLANLGHEVHLISGPPYPDKPEGVVLHKVPNPNFFEKGSKAIGSLSIKGVLHPLNVYEWAASRFGNLPEIMGFSLRLIREIGDLHGRIGFDVIHDNQCLGYGFLMTRLLGVPQVATVHHPLNIDREKSVSESWKLFDKLTSVLYYPMMMQQISIRAFDHIITVSKASAQDIQKYFGVPEENIQVIPNGIDEDLFRPTKQNSQESGSDPKDTEESRFLFVGETENKHKGFRVLLQALYQLIKRGKNCRLRVVNGTSPESEYTEKLVRRFGLEENVEFIGRISTLGLVEEYASATAAVLPSLHEGFGFPAIEAMSCGTPLVATTSGALPEIVPAEAGILVPPGDVTKLAEALQTIHENPKKREKMGIRGRREVKNRFAWEQAAKKVLGVYQEVVK